MTPLTFTPLGDSAVRVGLTSKVDPAEHRRVLAFDRALAAASVPGVIEWVPTYLGVTVHYRPHEIRYAEICRRLGELAASSRDAALPPSREYVLPVCYGGEFGPDLEFVAKHHGLGPAEIAARHSRPAYFIYMLGFAPGFPYLGNLPEELTTPRLDVPRKSVPAGSVGIGGSQTGVYPLATPGGWRIIGRTPVRLWDPARRPPVALEAGNWLRFRPVTAEEFAELERRGAAVEERPHKEEKKP
jgi:inhibitor of KinA